MSGLSPQRISLGRGAAQQRRCLQTGLGLLNRLGIIRFLYIILLR